MQKQHSLILLKKTFADQIDHSSGSASGINGIKQKTFMPREQPDRFSLPVSDDAVARVAIICIHQNIGWSKLDALANLLAGRRSAVTIPARIVRPALMLPFSPAITGLPHCAVPYFFLEQMHDSTRARELLEPHGIRCPRFPDYVGALISFVAAHPKLG